MRRRGGVVTLSRDNVIVILYIHGRYLSIYLAHMARISISCIHTVYIHIARDVL